MIPLTARQLAVLALAAEGHSNKGIARALRIGEATVSQHLSNVFVKLGVSDRTHAVVKCFRAGLLR